MDLSREDRDHMALEHLVQGYLALHKAGLLLPCLTYKAPDKLAEDLMDSVFKV